ncbi:hypothetical protein [Halobacteriovorax sp. YZS-1-2]|uniref:hypothetical protein n=1 Tax=Halobacteriovorax sp. YZS-1-2 TaxID=3391177 RepID=UPI00399B6830
MKPLFPVLMLLSLSSFANTPITFKEANVALSYKELESEVFYNVEDVKLKDVKYIRSFDNRLYIPSSKVSEILKIKDLPISGEIDTVILKPLNGVDGGGRIKIPVEQMEQLEQSMHNFRMTLGGEGGT